MAFKWAAVSCFIVLISIFAYREVSNDLKWQTYLQTAMHSILIKLEKLKIAMEKFIHDYIEDPAPPSSPVDHFKLPLHIVPSFCALKPFQNCDLNKYKHLVILGHVFDVSGNAKNYGPKGNYAFFTGRDATRAFVSGDFTEKGLVSHLDGLSTIQMLELATWLDFMIEKYPCVGFHVGLYYALSATPTDYLNQYLDARHKLKEQKAFLERHYPACILETRGEDLRAYVCKVPAVPREFHDILQKTHRCACVQPSSLNDLHVKTYEQCPNPHASECIFSGKKDKV